MCIRDSCSGSLFSGVKQTMVSPRVISSGTVSYTHLAMRSIPALEKYCELAREYASPGVKIFNFTNPAGVVSQTLRDMGYDFTFGICDAPSELLRSLADLYGVKPEEVTGDCYGLNHLSFFPSIQVQGREVMPDLLSRDDIYHSTQMRFFDKELAMHFGCVLNEYLYYY